MAGGGPVAGQHPARERVYFGRGQCGEAGAFGGQIKATDTRKRGYVVQLV